MVCGNTDQDYNHITPDAGTMGGGGGGGATLAYDLLNHSLFQHAGLLLDPNRRDLLNYVMNYIQPVGLLTGVTLADSQVIAINQKLDVFMNNPQLFDNFDLLQAAWSTSNYYFPGTANYYDQRIVKLMQNLFDNPTQQNADFTSWATQFYMQNPNTSLAQFQNWFTNGYSDTYRTKLSLLSPIEIQEFVSINTEIDASLYDEEFVKETNEAFVAFTAYGDIDTMTDAQIQTVLNQCCPSIIVVPQAMTIEKSRMIVATYRFNRKFYPEWSKTKCFWEASRETIQLLLDLGGLAPVIGEVCDLTNGVIYTIQGDGLNASLSYASAIPVAGWFAAGSKYGVKVINASDIASRQVLKWIVGNDGLIKFGYSSQLRKVLKLTDATKQAHHIIPWAYNIQIHSVVQKAAKSADAFHLNEALNGIAVASWRNQPNHPNYTNLIFGKLEAFRISNPNATPNQCYDELIDIISDARQAIINNPNTHLNNLVF